MKLNPKDSDLKICLCHKNPEITLDIRASLDCRINNKSSFEEGHRTCSSSIVDCHHMKCVIHAVVINLRLSSQSVIGLPLSASRLNKQHITCI